MNTVKTMDPSCLVWKVVSSGHCMSAVLSCNPKFHATRYLNVLQWTTPLECELTSVVPGVQNLDFFFFSIPLI